MSQSTYKKIAGLLSLVLFSILLCTKSFAALQEPNGNFIQWLKIGATGAANTNAALDISSITKGILLPRMTSTQRDAIVSPATSLMIFNLTTNQYEFYNGASWAGMGGGGGASVATTGVLGTVFALNATSHNFVTGITSGTGAITIARPACADVSDAANSCSTTAASTNTASNIVLRDGSGNFSAGTITAALTGTASGNLTASPSNHGMLISSGTNAVTVLPPDASTTKVWTSGGSSADPSWQTPTGGFSNPMTTLGDIIYENASPAPARLAGNTAFSVKFLASAGSGTVATAPTWQVPDINQLTGFPVGVAKGGTGQDNTANPGILVFDGLGDGDSTTAPAIYGGTGLTTYALGDMLYSSAANTLSALAGNTTSTKKFLTQTGTGAVSAAPTWGTLAAGDVPTLNQNTTGSAAKWTTARNLAGNSVDGSANVAFANKFIVQGTTDAGLSAAQFLGALGTGIVKNTTTTGVLSIAVAGDFPTLNQNTSGTAANITGVAAIANGGTNNGSLGVTAGSVLYADGSKVVSLPPGTVSQVLKGGTTPAWGTSSGSINFITNPDAETDASSWNLYGTAGQNPPADGTTSVGGPVQSFARTTSTPLTGTGSFLLTHPASNAQGYGVSTDFTIDNASQAKVMNIEFDYSVASGTFVAGSTGVDSDVEIWIYDVTNAKIIQPSTYKLYASATSPPTHFFSSFQTASNSTSYRLIYHFATTASSAFTLKFDSVSAAPSKYTYGTPETDWITYVPVFSAGFGSPLTNIFFQYRRVGDSIFIRGRATAATTAASAAGIGLPTGLTIDDSKLQSTIQKCGTSSRIGTDNVFDLLCLTGSSTSLGLGFGTTRSTNTNVSTLLATGNTFTVDSGPIPVTGFSSTVQMSDSAPQSAVASIATAPTSGAITAGSWAAITGYSGVTDSLGTAFNASTGTYTVIVPGWYTVTAGVEIIGTGVAGATEGVRIVVNGGAIAADAKVIPTVSTALAYNASIAATYLNVGNTILAQRFSGRTSPTYTSAAVAPSFSVSRLASPTSIGATETVAAYYTGAPPTGTLTNTLNLTTFATKVNDTHSAYSGGTYTVPAPGTYSISAGTQQTATYTASQLADTAIFINGVDTAEGVAVAGGAAGTLYPAVSIHAIKLKAGDLVTIRSENTGSSTSFGAAATVNYFSIVRVGL